MRLSLVKMYENARRMQIVLQHQSVLNMKYGLFVIFNVGRIW